MNRLEFLFTHAKPGRFLDIGNMEKGGRIHQQIIDKFSGSEIHGVDIVDQTTLGLNFPNQKIGSFEALEYPDNFFDTIYMGEVLEHTWKPKLVLDECFKVLKPGGRLIFDTPNVYSLSRMIRYFFTGKDITLGNPDHKIFFSKAMIDALLDQVGFKDRIIATEVNFDTMTLKCKLPPFGPFLVMGECLIVMAEKPVN